MNRMKCIWCNKELSKEEIEANYLVGEEYSKKNCCSEECKTHTEDFYSYGKKNTAKFLLLILASVFGMVIINIIYMANKVNSFPAGGFAWLGVIFGFTIFKYPFCTPQTNKGLGIKVTIKIAKIIGVIFLIVGLISLIFTIKAFI